MKDNIKLAISGGKGGVGKSMLTSSLVILFNQDYDVSALDCDVDTPNLGIWLDEVGNWEQTEEISVSERPVIKEEVDNPEACVEQCQFNAFKVEQGNLKVDPFLCEGCGACEYFCSGVKEMKEVQSGWIKSKVTDYGFPLIVGQLKTGETGSGEIVTKIKKRAEKFESEVQIIDTAPGTGCPVVAALQNTDFVVLITEPSKSALSDLKAVKEVVDHFDIDFGVVVNKWNVNENIYKEIKDWAGEAYLGKLNYDQKVIKAASELKPIMETDSEVKEQIKDIFNEIKNYLNL